MKALNLLGLVPSLSALLLVGLLGSAPEALAGTPAEEANKELVLNFYAALNQAEAEGKLKERIGSIAEQYLQPDYVQHDARFAALGAGRGGFIKLLQQMPAMPSNAHAKAPETVAVMAEGDRVMLLTSRENTSGGGGPESRLYIFNMFRVQDGKLAEHWDVSPAAPAGPPAPGAPH